MFHKVFQPHPALRDFVNNIMIFRVSLDTSIDRPIMSFPPLPENCLYFYPFERPEAEHLTRNKKIEVFESVIIGAQVNRIHLKMPYNVLTIKVGFQPGGLYRLMGIPLTEFVLNESFDSAYIFDKEVNFIADQLREADSYTQMIQVVETFLLKKLQLLRQKLPIDSVLPAIIKKDGLINIDEIARASCVSIRQLERQFQQRIGMSPKFFVRLVRFSKAWTMKEHNPSLRWTAIAYECGYFDQMHLIRDFKEFAGVAPSVIEAEFNNSPYLLHNQLHF